MIQRVPRVAAEALRHLALQKLLGRNVWIVGTNALYAYEAAAGAYVDTSITAAGDLDIRWDARSRLTLVADNNIDQIGLLDILRKADRSFELSGPRSFRAVNRDGYMVDLIKSEPKQMLKLWLSKQVRREAVKKQRDHDQALAVANLIVKYLPQYKFKATELRMFPKAIFAEAEKDISELELPSGFDNE